MFDPAHHIPPSRSHTRTHHTHTHTHTHAQTTNPLRGDCVRGAPMHPNPSRHFLPLPERLEFLLVSFLSSNHAAMSTTYLGADVTFSFKTAALKTGDMIRLYWSDIDTDDVDLNGWYEATVSSYDQVQDLYALEYTDGESPTHPRCHPPCSIPLHPISNAPPPASFSVGTRFGTIATKAMQTWPAHVHLSPMCLLRIY